MISAEYSGRLVHMLELLNNNVHFFMKKCKNVKALPYVAQLLFGQLTDPLGLFRIEISVFIFLRKGNIFFS